MKKIIKTAGEVYNNLVENCNYTTSNGDAWCVEDGDHAVIYYEEGERYMARHLDRPDCLDLEDTLDYFNENNGSMSVGEFYDFWYWNNIDECVFEDYYSLCYKRQAYDDIEIEPEVEDFDFSGILNDFIGLVKGKSFDEITKSTDLYNLYNIYIDNPNAREANIEYRGFCFTINEDESGSISLSKTVTYKVWDEVEFILEDGDKEDVVDEDIVLLDAQKPLLNIDINAVQRETIAVLSSVLACAEKLGVTLVVKPNSHVYAINTSEYKCSAIGGTLNPACAVRLHTNTIRVLPGDDIIVEKKD